MTIEQSHFLKMPSVSSRHLDRLKGLLAKTEGTIALGGRSNDETRFDMSGIKIKKIHDWGDFDQMI